MPKRYVQTGDDKKLLLRELSLMFSVLRPFVTLTSETWQGYAMALDDLTSPQIMQMVPLVLKKRWEFPPQPAEIRDLIIEAENNPVKESRDDCPNCQGTGFAIVMIDGARKAQPCECRKTGKPADVLPSSIPPSVGPTLMRAAGAAGERNKKPAPITHSDLK